jgi:hypothetical protein
VNGAYAVWEDGYNCYPPRIGQVVLYNIRTDTKTPLRLPENISQQSPAVSSDGTVYFVRRNTQDET